MSTFAEKAQFYRQLGWPVFPLHFILDHGTPQARCSCGDKDCARPGKHPFIRRRDGGKGKDDATIDGDQIDIWSDTEPRCNIGGVTGPLSRICVVDVDGEDGLRSVDELAARNYPLYDTAIATSGRGKHFYYRHIGGLKTSAGSIARGIDIRAEGGQIVLPPSLHMSGRTYQWLVPPTIQKPRIAPLWIPRILEQRRQDKQRGDYGSHVAESERARYGNRRPPMEVIDVYAQRVAVLSKESGNRNHTLNEQSFNAFRDCKKFNLDERAVESRLLAAAKACGLTFPEARATISSARRGAYAKT